MEQIMGQIIIGLVAIIASATSLGVAWIESKKRKVEEGKHKITKTELTKERNGFREQIVKELALINSRLAELEKKVDK